mmetsp:Transcript_8832/g.19059  ORF Transcript_8832/g.19059 Transcript_8832/m.19059 type:complete len:659 (-) Transcript_8832:410-2386(-)
MKYWKMNIQFLALVATLLYCCTITTVTIFASAFFSPTPIRRRCSSVHRLREEQDTNNNNDARLPPLSFSSRSSASSVARLSSLRLYSSKQPPPPQTPDFFKGAPSMPGFKAGQFEKLTSWATSTAANRPIVTEYEPDGFWLWTQWGGTIREMTYKNVIISVLWSLLVDFYCYQHYTFYLIATAAVNGGDVSQLMEGLSWASFDIPHSKDPIIDTLTALGSLWEYQLNFCIFTLSFFVNHAYGNWRSVYLCTRAIQGRLNDLCMLVTMAAKRSATYGAVEGVTGYDARLDINLDNNSVSEKDSHFDAKKLVSDVTRYLRMSHVFFWAATPTCSDGFGDVHHTEGGIVGDDMPEDFDTAKFGPMLLSMDGLNMLVKYGQLTDNERNALVATGLPPSQYPYVLLEWAGLRCIDGMEHGELRGGQGMEENLLRYFTQLRAEYFSIGDFAAGRMPMAYVQFMEVLVDTLIILAPLALYVKMGTFNIISTALLTLFFKGLLELSKSFLDPFGREGYRAHNIRVDVLVSEMNFGASSRWVDAGDALPSELLERSYNQINEDPSEPPPVVNYQEGQSEHRTVATAGRPPMPKSQDGEFAAWMAEDHDMLTKESPNAHSTIGMEGSELGNNKPSSEHESHTHSSSSINGLNTNGFSQGGQGVNGSGL